MAKYIMALKGKGAELNSIIWNTDASDIREAKQYFVKLKQLPEKEFDKLFVVAEVNDNGTRTEPRIFERNPDTGKIRSRKAGDYGNERDEN